jgi:hypothetical protein
MVRHTKPLSGGAKDKFLRGLVDAVAGVPDAARLALERELTQGIAEVRVRREAYERIREQPERPTTASTVAAAMPAHVDRATFDPFAFSVVAVLTKQGRPALQAALDKIETVEDLRRIGDAQHLALDPALTIASDIRTAIVSGAEQRIAERKAAAS